MNKGYRYIRYRIRKIIGLILPQNIINLLMHLPIAVYANLKYGFPAKSMKVIGVSGTDGKTTTVNMIYHILKDAGKKVSMVSTINAYIGDQNIDTGFHVTSPGPMDIQKLIKKAKDFGSEYLILEATSQALDQYRFWGISYDIVIITNVTRDHLDYHKNFENYLKAKGKLVIGSKTAVLNIDEKENYKKLSKLASGEIVSFGLSKEADFNPRTFPLTLKLPGEFSTVNALAASAVCSKLGIARTSIVGSLAGFNNLPGRMEKIKNKNGLNIYVDFAHTPNALEKALKTLATGGSSKLLAVFGAAADRDEGKRALMGRIAAENADILILTDEDPRFEDSMKIINEIALGAVEAGAITGENLYLIPDRRKAIETALKIASKGDTIGVFGKGHEKSMNYRGVEKPWSDVGVIEELLG